MVIYIPRMDIDIRAIGPERHGDLVAPILTAFGAAPVPERVEQMKRLPELDLRLGAFDGDLLVGGTGVFNFAMTVPGGEVPTVIKATI